MIEDDMKYLKLSPEYQCSPLWVSLDGDIYKNIEIDEFDFNKLLKEKLLTWANSFDDTLNQEYPPDSGFKNLEEENIFERLGFEIWREIFNSYSDFFNIIFFKSYKLGKLYSSFEDYESDINKAP